MLVSRPTETTDRDETEEHECQTAHIDRRSADMWEQEPTDDSTNDIASRKRNVHVECLKFREAGRFEKFHRKPKDGITTKNLSSPYNAILRAAVSLVYHHGGECIYTDNFGASQIGSSETIEKACFSGLRLFHIARILDVCKGRIHLALLLGVI